MCLSPWPHGLRAARPGCCSLSSLLPFLLSPPLPALLLTQISLHPCRWRPPQTGAGGHWVDCATVRPTVPVSLLRLRAFAHPRSPSLPTCAASPPPAASPPASGLLPCGGVCRLSPRSPHAVHLWSSVFPHGLARVVVILGLELSCISVLGVAKGQLRPVSVEFVAVFGGSDCPVREDWRLS